VVCEAAIDALSLAALEVPRADTLYTATAGGMGPATIAALRHILAALAGEHSAIIVAATDADEAGRHHAARLKELAAKARVRFVEILPPGGLNDWNDAIRSVSLRQ
jgi:predicted nuclease with TOPRIM domain